MHSKPVNLHKGNTLHFSLHRDRGSAYLSLWDEEEQARNGGVYIRLVLTEEQREQIEVGVNSLPE